MDKLTILAKYHKEWVKIVNTFGEYFLAEDIVQETYLKIHRLNHIEKIVTDKVNRSLMWLILRSVYIDHLRLQKHDLVSLELIDNVRAEEGKEDQHESYERLDKLIKHEIDNWHWYDKMLFNLYADSGLSMREISKETNISLTSIFHTLKNCKQRLRESVGEEFEDYLNEDFDLIK